MKCLYVGSFDPLHIGHYHVIYNSPGELTIGLAENSTKKPFLSVNKRMTILQSELEKINKFRGESTSVALMPSDEYVAEWALDNKIEYIIRGLRNSSDLEYEKTLAKVYKDINFHLKFLYIIPPPEMLHISSTLIKSLLGFKGQWTQIQRYVDPETYLAIKDKVCSL